MEHSQHYHYQSGMQQQYEHRRREELMKSRAVPGIKSTTGIPPKYYSEEYKFPRSWN